MKQSMVSRRKELGLSRFELAKKLGVSRQAISNYENGLRRPRPESMKKIANALNLKLEDAWSMFYGKEA